MRAAALCMIVTGLTAGCSEFVELPATDAGSTGDAIDTSAPSPCDGRPCDDGNDCTVDMCDEADGSCTFANNVGATCTDGDPCTRDERCEDMVCVGDLRECDADPNDCIISFCDQAKGDCVHQEAADGVTCSDGDPCTDGDTCTEGQCTVGPAVECDAPTSDCLRAVCQDDGAGEAECVEQPLAKDAPCDDGDHCTSEDACTPAGECAGVAPDCSHLDVGCTVGACDPVASLDQAEPVCVQTNAQDGSGCDDNVPCTTDDACISGQCAGVLLTCESLDGPCQTGQCDDSGQCVSKPLSDGTLCDDGDSCSNGEACDAGACVGGVIKDCTLLDSGCVVGLCNEAGSCVPGPGPDGGACNDASICTLNDACLDGVCTGTPKDCTLFDAPCATGSCNPANGQCESKPDLVQNGMSCEDGLFCTVASVCEAGQCKGEPRDCSGVAVGCQVGVCKEAFDACVPEAVAEGQACDDGKVCTTVDTCKEGVCSGESVVDCSDLDGPCLVGTCSEESGCVAQPKKNGTGCDDGTACTDADSCKAGVCGGTMIDCSASTNDCGVGVCDPDLQACVAKPVPDGTFCTDGVECTIGDSCQEGSCAPGPAVDCPCLSPSRAIRFTGGCLTVENPPAIAAKKGFTVEFWMRTESLINARLLDQRITAELGEPDWSISYVVIGGKGLLRFHYGNTTSADSQIGMSSVMLNDGGWHHIALARDDSTVRWFVDGTGITGNLTNNIQDFAPGTPLTVGCGRFGDQAFDGAIDELRISNFARYVTSFEPPGRHYRDVATLALFHLDETVSPSIDVVAGVTGTWGGAVSPDTDTLLELSTCCGDGMLTAGEECDVEGGAPDCTAQCVNVGALPTGSLALAGSGCAVVKGPVLASLTDLTMELWLRGPSNASVVTLLDKQISTAGGESDWSLTLEDGRPTIAIGNQSGGQTKFTLELNLLDGDWHHLALTIKQSPQSARWFVDGVAQGTPGSLMGTKPMGNAVDLRVGCDISDSHNFTGQLDGIRITNAIRYTASYDVPAVPIPDNDTLLLLLFDTPAADGQVPDSSSTGATVLLTGDATLTGQAP